MAWIVIGPGRIRWSKISPGWLRLAQWPGYAKIGAGWSREAAQIGADFKLEPDMQMHQ